jgi:CarD family transcriptional regulator
VEQARPGISGKVNSGELRALAEVVRDLQTTDGSGSSFSQRNLFELALDRLAAEFAAVNRTAKVEAIGQLNQALRESRMRVAQPEHQSVSVGP